MESLSKPEKGWQTQTNLATGRAGSANKGRVGGRRTSKRKEGDGGAISLEFPVAPPKTSMVFERDWRRHCKTRELKLRYLALCGPEVIRRIFRTEIDVSLLSQFLEVMAEAANAFASARTCGDEEITSALVIFDTISVLPSTGRFALNTEFMTAADKSNAEICINWLERITGDSSGGGNGTANLAARRPACISAVATIRGEFRL